MTTTVIELYDALIEAGASEDKSRRAAQAVTDFDGQLGSVERRIDAVTARLDLSEVSVRADIASFRAEVRAEFLEVRSDTRRDISSLRTDLSGEISTLRLDLKGEIAGLKTEAGIMKVMLGLIVTLSIAVFLKLFLH